MLQEAYRKESLPKIEAFRWQKAFKDEERTEVLSNALAVQQVSNNVAKIEALLGLIVW